MPDRFFLSREVVENVAQFAVGVEMCLFGKWDVASLGAALQGPAAAGAKEFAFYQDTSFEEVNFRGNTNVWKELGEIVKP